MDPRYPQKKLAEAGVFATAQANSYGSLDGILKMNYTSNSNLAAQESGIGKDGPDSITSEYTGAQLTLELKEQGSIEKLLAYLMRQQPSAFTGFDPLFKVPAFFWFNEKRQSNLKRHTSHFIWGAVLQNQPKEISGQPGARQFQFMATMAREFKGAIQVDAFTGNATPVTSLAPTKTTMLAWKNLGVDRFALAIVRYSAAGGVTVLDKDLGEYTETATGVTLTTGLGTGETAVMAYICAEF